MKLIIDCDPGVDDMEAILMAFATPNVEILAITTCGGNGASERVFQNARKICHFCEKGHIPVFRGPKCSLAGFPHATDSYFGSDSMGEIELEDILDQGEEVSAASALVDIAKKHKGEVVLVATGPLTNVACAYFLDEKFPSYLKDMYVMGGDRAATTTMNVTAHAEFNAWCDPAAFHSVMKNFEIADGKPIKLIDFEFCRRNLIPISEVETYYGAHTTEVRKNVRSRMASLCYPFMKGKFSPHGTITADPFTMYLALYPQSPYKSKRCTLSSVCMEGEKYGHTIFVDDPNGRIELIDEIDFADFLKVLRSSVDD